MKKDKEKEKLKQALRLITTWATVHTRPEFYLDAVHTLELIAKTAEKALDEGQP